VNPEVALAQIREQLERIIQRAEELAIRAGRQAPAEREGALKARVTLAQMAMRLRACDLLPNG